MLIVEQFMCREDNFGVLIHDEAANLTAAIDAPEYGPIKERLDARGWNLDHIFTTHHHPDHVEGNLALKKATGAHITGPAREAEAIPGLDTRVTGGDSFTFGGNTVRVIDTPGHTLGQIAYWLPDANLVFVADALFSLGCGRIIEGTPAQMWSALQSLAALPDDTTVYCGHEYTEANARFALSVEPGNADLQARAAEVAALRRDGQPTLPTTIAQEKRTNPFLRPASQEIRTRLGMASASDADVFAELRRRKDSFR